MPNARKWVLASVGCWATIGLVSFTHAQLEKRWLAAGRGALPVQIALPLQILGVLAILVFLTCVPAAMLSSFVSGQRRIGNGHLPMVVFVERHFTAICVAVLGLWLTGFLVALPYMLREARGGMP